MKIVDIQNLNVYFNGKKGRSHLVRDVSFSLETGKCLCVLGESGSGKSMTMKAIMGLLDTNFYIEGVANFNGRNLLTLNKEEVRQVRGKELSMVLQNPMVCFDSLYRIESQMAETFRTHTDWSKEEIYINSTNALQKMMIRDPEEVLKKYPHQLSGGILQRIMIAIALTLNPSLLIADEPTTAIDAITQFEIMKEFQKLKNDKITMIFITHDLAVASLIADEILVMNQGKIVDKGTFSEIMQNPQDTYTQLLIEKRMAVMDAYTKVFKKS